MPVYAYRGVGKGNRAVRGTIEAESPRGARQKLRIEAIFPTQLNPVRSRSATSELLSQFQLPQLRRVPDLELALFSSQLATLLGAGVPLVESLSALTEQIEHHRLKAVTAELRSAVNEGASLADAMSAHQEVFDTLYRSLVRAGETSGSLALVLRRLAEYIESRMLLRNQITSAMVYPMILLSVSGIVLGVLLVQVIPSITSLLEDLDQELPLLTRIVIACSDFLVDWWLAIAIGVAGGLLLFNRAIATERGRLVWDRLRLRLPILGRTMRYVSISRFARTLSTLLTGGVDIVQALDIAKSVSGNAVIRDAVDGARESIVHGSSIAGPLRQSGEFPPLLTHMVAVGEASGELDAMLTKVSDTYDDLTENALARFTAVLSPVLLLFVAGVVVLIILSTLLPLMNLTAAL